MLIRGAIRAIRRVVRLPARRERAAPLSSPDYSELSRVNALAGVEPVRPELSGLALRRATIPRRVTRSLIQIAYRWYPSADYQRRQIEMRLMNHRLRGGSGRWRRRHSRLDVLPPILTYPEENDVAPARLQPMLDPLTWAPELRELAEDLPALEAAEERRRPPQLVPRLAEIDPEYLLGYRPLLPRRCRHFLRSSPYPRAALCIAAATLVAAGFLWVSRSQQAIAVAAGRAHVVQHSFEVQLGAAVAFGVDRRDLAPIERHARALQAVGAPLTLLPSRRESFYRLQAQSYRSLLHELRRLERHALAYWTWEAGVTYTAEVEATQAVTDLGLRTPIPSIPACSTPACDRSAVAGERARITQLRGTVRTLRVYGAAVAASADPASTAGSMVQEVDSLGVLVAARPPFPVGDLNSGYAAAGDMAGYARVGALARLDHDALEAALIRTLPRRAIVISVERGTLGCYQSGRRVFGATLTAASGTPTGVFHIQVKQAAVPVLYWNGAGKGYLHGILPDWMEFSDGAALQGAPWRVAFGPDSASMIASYAPSTPRSIDLPAAAASSLYRWASVGTEIVVY